MASSSEEDIELHEVGTAHKRSGRIHRRIKKIQDEPKLRSVCWRWFLFIVITGLMVTMLVQLYSSYGEFITDQIFPPRISSGGVVCPNGTVVGDYQLAFDGYENVDDESDSALWIRLNATKPKESLELAWVEDAHLILPTRWRGDDTLLVWAPRESVCAKVLVFSM